MTLKNNIKLHNSNIKNNIMHYRLNYKTENTKVGKYDALLNNVTKK